MSDGNGCGCVITAVGMLVIVVVFLAIFAAASPSMTLQQLLSPNYSIESRATLGLSIVAGMVALTRVALRITRESRVSYLSAFRRCECASVGIFCVVYVIATMVFQGSGSGGEFISLLVGAALLGFGVFTVLSGIVSLFVSSK